MNPGSLVLLIPVLALSIPVVALIFNGLTKLAEARKAAIEAQ